MRRLARIHQLHKASVRASSSRAPKKEAKQTEEDIKNKAVAPPPSKEAGGPKGVQEAGQEVNKPFPYPVKDAAETQAEKPNAPANRPSSTPGGGKELPGDRTEGLKAKMQNGNGKGGGGNQWLLSRSLPIDVRLLVAALAAGGGALTYLYYDRENQQKQFPGSARQDAGPPPNPKKPGHPPDSASPSGTGASSAGAPSAEGSTERPQAEGSNFYTEELALQANDANLETIAEAGGEPEQGSSHAAEGTNEVKQGIPGLTPEEVEAHTQAVADVLNSVLTSQIQIVDAAKEENQLKNLIAGSPTDPDAGSEEESVKSKTEAQIEDAHVRRQESDRKLQETLSVLKENVADTSGETLWSSASSQLDKLIKVPEEPAAEVPETGEPKSDSSDAAEFADDPKTSAALGISEDLRPAALIRRAIDRGEGSGDDWAEFQQRLKQAESDATTFNSAKRQALEAKQRDIGRLESEISDRDRLLEEADGKAKQKAAAHRNAFQEQSRALLGQKQEELKRQSEYLATAFAEAAAKERASRIGALDQVRIKLNSLTQAFNHRSDQQATSHSVHKLMLGVFALSNALDEGLPASQQKAALQASCADDGLISLAIDSLPKSTGNQGVATRAQLLQRWPDVRRLASQLAYLPPGETSFVQLGLASLASRLKIKETAVETTVHNSVDQALAHAEADLVNGKYADAAEQLEKGLLGTAAESAISGWTEVLKARAVADQAMKLLEAHASAQAASVC